MIVAGGIPLHSPRQLNFMGVLSDRLGARIAEMRATHDALVTEMERDLADLKAAHDRLQRAADAVLEELDD